MPSDRAPIVVAAIATARIFVVKAPGLTSEAAATDLPKIPEPGEDPDPGGSEPSPPGSGTERDPGGSGTGPGGSEPDSVGSGTDPAGLEAGGPGSSVPGSTYPPADQAVGT
jgi:hypothetical protein